MRGSKSLLVLVAIALAVGGYSYYLSKHPPATDTTKHDKLFPSASSDTITDIEVRADNGDTTHLTKDGSTWTIAAPAAADADASEASNLVSTLGSIESERVLDANPASVKDYALDPPRVTITFKAAGDATPHTLLLGAKTPNGSDMYARVGGQPAVLLVAGSYDDSLNKNTFNLRDKTVLKFQHDAADMVAVTASGKTVTLAKQSSSQWRVKSPVDARGDFSTIDGLVGKLVGLQMKSLVAADGSKDLKPYGLDKPDYTATIGAGSARATLAIGGKSPDGSLYARDLSRPVVFTVDASIADDLKRKPEDYRAKDLFDFRSFNATSVELTRGGETYVFTKTKGANGEDVWKEAKPAAKDLDQAKFSDLLFAVSGLRADSFADKAASGADDLAVSASFADNNTPRTEKVEFRKSGATTQAIRAGEPGAAVVASADYDKAIAALKAITGEK